MLDEWGTWWDEEPGTINGHLYQQNTMRDFRCRLVPERIP